MQHRLDPLLRPKTVAVVGASRREDSLGEWVMKNLDLGGFAGDIYPVNPSYDELAGRRCYASLDELPAVPDMVVFAVADHRVEQALDEAIALSVPAAVIMSTLYLDDDTTPPLKERIAGKISQSGMLVCGANGMGFYNVRDRVWACGFDSAPHEPPGSISLISHSGSGMCGIIDCDARVQINFAVSTGNEISVSMDEYLDFVLDLPETRAVGLFVETARNPQGFRDALQKAVDRSIPIVALKVGRTRKSAELTISHSGAMAGDDDTYDALFDRYGVLRVADMDELATALIVSASMHPLGEGGLVSIHDSGGERQLLVDLADEAGVPLTELSEATVRSLRETLEPELLAVNPLDAWSRGGPDAGQRMQDSFVTMMCDPGAALGAVMHDRAPRGEIYPSYLRHVQAGSKASGKPAALVAARQGTGSDPAVIAATLDGFPVLDGIQPFLKAVRGLMDYRDYRNLPASEPPAADIAIVNRWRERLSDAGQLDEADALGLLGDFGIRTSRPVPCADEASLLDAANNMSWPLVLKTASGIAHKTEAQGVCLGLRDTEELRNAYHDLAARLGAQVVLAEMAPRGIEMLLGARFDPQFGPVVIMGFGGIHAEILRDIFFVLPPFDAALAKRKLDKLRLRSMLDGVRGAAAIDVAAYCDAAAKFSVAVDALGEEIAELDVNPIIVSESGCVAVDALIVARKP